MKKTKKLLLVLWLFFGAKEMLSDSWTTKANMLTARVGHAIGVVNGKIYVIGGYNGSSYLSTNEEYDPATDSWTTKTDMPTGRIGLAIGVVNNKIYAVGGYNSGSVGGSSTNEEYDPATDSWTTKTDMLTARLGLDIGVVNGKIYAIGGYNSSSGYLSTNEKYDPATDSWTTKTDMSTARRYFAVGVVNNKIYAIGGSNLSELSANEEYDPATDSWTTKTPMPTARFGLDIGVVNGKIYAIGGRVGSSVLSTNEEYSPDILGEQDKIPPKKGKEEISSLSEILSVPSIFTNEILLKFVKSSPRSLRIYLYTTFGTSVLVRLYPYTPLSITLKGKKIKGLSSGIYFLSISYGDRKDFRTMKLIKP